jgi:hypothetical protein
VLNRSVETRFASANQQAPFLDWLAAAKGGILCRVTTPSRKDISHDEARLPTPSQRTKHRMSCGGDLSGYLTFFMVEDLRENMIEKGQIPTGRCGQGIA